MEIALIEICGCNPYASYNKGYFSASEEYLNDKLAILKEFGLQYIFLLNTLDKLRPTILLLFQPIFSVTN